MTRKIAQRGANAQLPGVSRGAAEQHFAIVLDEQVIAAPSVDFTRYSEGIDANTGSAIVGGYTPNSAQALAVALRFGALPVKLELVSRSRAWLPSSGGAS